MRTRLKKWRSHKKIVLGLLLTTLMIATMLLSFPVAALDYYSWHTGERQIVAYGMLHDELFPEYNYTKWQRRSINVGFTAYGEMVTDQDPFGTGSSYGVGLTYPTDSAWQIDMPAGTNGTDYGIYPCEHIATPTKSGVDWRYFPIEGWQLYWKFKNGTLQWAIDPNWHVSMAIYGNISSPYRRARVNVIPESETIITNTSRLLVAQVKVLTDNKEIEDRFGFESRLFEITGTFVFFKDTKEIASYWTIEYLKTEYGALDVVFRRMTSFDIDQKFQEGEAESFSVFYANSRKGSWKGHLTGLTAEEGQQDHMFWTGCEYWPQNYSLAVVWTNSSVAIWVPPNGYSVAPQHHVAFVAYYPNCSNWDTDNWNHFTYDLHIAPVIGEGLGRRFGYQPLSVEYRSIDANHYAAANLLLGQWNFTLSSSTAFRKAEFLTLYGITNCSDTFGYVGSPSSYDWDSRAGYCGQITAGELKYMLSEYFNTTYKLSTETKDKNGKPLDLSNWYPFSGVSWNKLSTYDGNVWIDRYITCDPRNTTFIYGASVAHNGMVFASEAASVIDVVGGTEVGEAFGSFISVTGLDPWWEAMWDTTGFMGEAYGPFYGVSPNFYKTVAGKEYVDNLGTIPLSWKLSGWRRIQNRTNGESGVDWGLFTMPTGASWDINHTIIIGGPKVNLASEYFNDHMWIIWVDPATTASELPEAGFFSIPTGTFYPASHGGYSLITIAEDLNLTSWTSIYDGEQIGDGVFFETNSAALDGPTLSDPYAGLLIYGISGFDTLAAAYWLAHYWCNFNTLYTNETTPNRGVTSVLLNTVKMRGISDNTWQWAIQELVGPVAGRWRAEARSNWVPWMSYLTSIDWTE